MKLTLDVEIRHWWIEKRDKGVNAMVKYRGKNTDGKEFNYEEEHHAHNLSDAVKWLESKLAE